MNKLLRDKTAPELDLAFILFAWSCFLNILQGTHTAFKVKNKLRPHRQPEPCLGTYAICKPFLLPSETLRVQLAW